jgi:hypothetical protein
MKNLLKALSIMIIPLMISCVEPQQREGAEGSLEIQGEETGGMGTGSGPGVNAPLDSVTNILPDTIIIN